MNIRSNIVNYLFDRDYIVCLYDDCAYFFNYKYLDSFGEKEIIVSLKGKRMTLTGEEMAIVKMTKEEILIRGKIRDVRVNVQDE